MDGHTDSTQGSTSKDYKSRPGALIWFFRKSRDGWKQQVPGPQGHRQGPQEPHRRRHQEPRAVADQGRAGRPNDWPPWKPRSPNSAPQMAARRRKKNGPRARPAELHLAEQQQVPCGQQYAVGVVLGFVSLVLDCGASLRCAASVLELARLRDRPRRPDSRSVDRPALAAAARAGGLAPPQGHRRRLGLADRPLDPDRRSASAWSSWASGSASCPRAGRWATGTWS